MLKTVMLLTIIQLFNGTIKEPKIKFGISSLLNRGINKGINKVNKVKTKDGVNKQAFFLLIKTI